MFADHERVVDVEVGLGGRDGCDERREGGARRRGRCPGVVDPCRSRRARILEGVGALSAMVPDRKV